MLFASSAFKNCAVSLRGQGVLGAALKANSKPTGVDVARYGAITTLTSLLMFVSAPAAMAQSPYGVWVDHTGRGAVEVKKCGSRLCGVIVWARKAADARRGCGRTLLGGLRQVGRNSWDHGWIIAPDSGSKYDLAIKPVGRNRLEILGYAGSKLFSKTMIWKRAPTSLKRCDEPKKPPQILAKAKKQPPKRPLGVGAPGVPLVPEVALGKAPAQPVEASSHPAGPISAEIAVASTSPRIERIQTGDGPPRVVYYDPPQSAPLPPRNPAAGSMMAQLALETAGLGVRQGPVRDIQTAEFSREIPSIVPPRPRLAQRPVEAQRVTDDLLVKIRNASAQTQSGCRIHAPFVVSSIPCTR